MPAPNDRPKRIRRVLRDFEGKRSLKQLVWEDLGYDRVNRPMARPPLAEEERETLAERPVLLAEVGDAGGFSVIYVRFDSEALGPARERAVVSALLGRHPCALFVFSNADQTAWHFVNARSEASEDEKSGGSETTSRKTSRRILRRLSVRPGGRLGTAAERLSAVALDRLEEQAGAAADRLAPHDVQSCYDDAFSAETLTRAFYDDYRAVFEAFKADLRAQSSDQRWAHEYALLFLNRCMFVHFVQRKGWLGGDPEFLDTFWHAYLDAPEEPADAFFPRWLSVLFFEVFSGTARAAAHDYFPSNVRTALANAPYLGEDVFRRGDLDEKRRRCDVQITDERLRPIFEMLGRYPFTVAEDGALDREIAVDPEMIGKVHESLANESAEGEERTEAGIFYTPRTEIDLMCRLSVVDVLANHLGAHRTPLVKQVVFAVGPEEKRRADDAVSSAGDGLWREIRSVLREMTAVDPACGAGAFLVGMLNILDDLLRRAGEQLGAAASAYDRRKGIIGRSLYGVDVMAGAARAAELRLGLALITQAGCEQADRGPESSPSEPLLPNVALNIRSGDALVQEVGGLRLGLRHGPRSERSLGGKLKERVQAFKAEKRAFLRGDPEGAYSGTADLREAEVALFDALLQERHAQLESEIRQLERRIDEPQARQLRLDGGVPEPEEAQDARAEAWEAEKETLASQAARVAETLRALRAEGKEAAPFVWDLAFIEVFSGAQPGFDVVIGNPPYVRQEDIADPSLPAGDVTKQSKTEYKAKLARTVYEAFPGFFAYDPARDDAAVEIDKKSDLYLYFFFYGLRLLAEDGTLCFITSNSWLDVGYGSELQEFLLRHTHIRWIIDSRDVRSFADADVNTAITLCSAPDDTNTGATEETARFMMLRAPYEALLESEAWIRAEEQTERFTAPTYRIFPVAQDELLKGGKGAQAGDEQESNLAGAGEDGPPKGSYDEGKWGGKYLRAPDIFWDVLERHAGRMVRLGDVADVRFGIKTGANAFFFLDPEDIEAWGIEDRYLVPALKNTRDARQIVVEGKDFPLKLFLCPDRREALQGTAALEYITSAEEQGLHERPTLAARSPWWSLGEWEPTPVACNYQIGKVQHFFAAEEGLLASNNFLFVRAAKDPFRLAAVLNSSWTQLWTNVMGRANFGGGLLKIETYETANIVTLDPALIPRDEAEDLLKAADLFKMNAPIRARLDELVFEAAGLSSKERREVQAAFRTLVERRHKKSNSR